MNCLRSVWDNGQKGTYSGSLLGEQGYGDVTESGVKDDTFSVISSVCAGGGCIVGWEC